MRIAIAQLNLVIGDIAGNQARIMESARTARDQYRADLIIFPELAITSYPPEDLLLRPKFLRLVEQALARLQPGDRVCDVGAGSGAIAVAIASERTDVQVAAVEISAAALAAAQRNTRSHGVDVALCRGDLLAPFCDGCFDMVVSNPPYVAEGELDQLQPDVRLHEPRQALVSGADGLEMIRVLIREAPDWLTPSGSLLMELAPEQAQPVKSLMENDNRYQDIRILKDLAGLPRVAAAQLAGA